jgi:transketolase
MTPSTIRQLILEQSKRANVGHIGSALSVVELLLAVYDGVLNIPEPDDPERDRFVLSKGHAALALYAILHLKGWISAEELNTFCGDNTLLGVHPEHQVCGIDFSSGSLGQGITIASGAALAARIQGSSRRVYALISDAECNEGSLWESAMFAAQHRLANLTVLLDLNGQQAFGYTREVLNLSNMAERWKAFGWHVQNTPGHDIPALQRALQQAQAIPDQPQLIIAQTTFGYGVSYMQNQIAWHYWPMSEAQYQQAQAEVEAL